MKTASNSTNSEVGNVIKQTLYALQVLIIALAIPVLSYMEVSHTDKKDEPSSQKNATHVITVKSGAVAYNETIK